jgi:hypothetical protein
MDRKESEDRDFYDAQGFGDGEYFMYVIEDEDRGGGGTSCYFWFSSPAQLLNAIKKHMDFWECREGWEVASRDLAEIIDKHPNAMKLDEGLRAELSGYVTEHASIHIYAWGTFNELCTGEDDFCREVRKDFRVWDDEDEECEQTVDVDKNTDSSRPIGGDETADFIEFLNNSPT